MESFFLCTSLAILLFTYFYIYISCCRRLQHSRWWMDERETRSSGEFGCCVFGGRTSSAEDGRTVDGWQGMSVGRDTTLRTHDRRDGGGGNEKAVNTYTRAPNNIQMSGARAVSYSNVPFINFAHAMFTYVWWLHSGGFQTSTETLAKNGIITPIFTENMLKNVSKLTDTELLQVYSCQEQWKLDLRTLVDRKGLNGY